MTPPEQQEETVPRSGGQESQIEGGRGWFLPEAPRENSFRPLSWVLVLRATLGVRGLRLHHSGPCCGFTRPLAVSLCSFLQGQQSPGVGPRPPPA